MKKKVTRNSVLGKKNIGKKQLLTGIPLLTSKGHKLKYQRYAETLSQMKIDFRMIPDVGSFTGYNKQHQIPIMNIDLNQFNNPSFDTSHYHIICKGLIIHECGHLRYSDFKVIEDNVNKSKEVKKIVEECANRYHKADESDKPQIETELQEKVFDFVKAVNMPSFLNSFEDASIERSMCELGKDENGCITFMRNNLYDAEVETKNNLLKVQQIPLTDDSWNDVTLEFVLGEARHMAVCAYKPNVDTTILKHLFETDEIQQIQDLALYARFGANTTGDRNVVAKTFLDMCDPILKNIANELTKAYINNINQANDKANQMQQSANQFGQSSSGTNSGDMGGGLPQSQPQKQSKYNLNLPEDLKNKMNQNAQQMGQGSQGQGGDTQSPKTASGQNDNQGQIPTPTQKELSDEAINNMNEVIRNAQRTIGQQEEMAENNAILNHPSVRAGENSFHKEVKLELGDFKESISSLGDYSYEGENAKNIIENKNISLYVNDLSQKIKKVLMHRSQDETSRGRFEGQLDTSNLYRINTDLQVFKKEVLGEKRHIRFAILVDESGSMSGSGLTNAILGCWIIAKAAQKLKIPFSVYGHSEHYSCRVKRYIEYKESSKKKSIDNLFYMNSGGCNRDGLAIYHVCRELVKAAKPNEDLYCLILSDGQPNGDGMSWEEGIQDIQKTVNTFKRFGVHTMGIGIGDDFDYEETVGKIYENAVIATEPSKLPNEMFKIFKKMLRV